MLSPHSTPPAARSELKKLLAARNVRKTIADPIMHRIFSGPVQPASTTSDTAATTNGDGDGESGMGAATPVGDEIAVVHVCPNTSGGHEADIQIASPKDLESEFAKMFPHFDVS